MKVLHVDTGKSWRGGQQQVFFLHRELTGAGIESRLVATTGGELASRAAAEGLHVRPMALRGEWDIASAWALAREIKREGITHLHLHSSHAQTLGLIAAKLSGLKNVIITKRVGSQLSRHPLTKWKYGPGVARFVGVSRAIARTFAEFGIPESKIRVVHSGMDPDRVEPGEGAVFREELALVPGEKLVGNVAHLSSEKGHDVFIDAMPLVLKAHPLTRFAIVGTGKLEGELKRRAARLGLGDRLVFTGFRTDVGRILDGMDLFVLSSTMEGIAGIVAEAMAGRTPVVATNVGGLPEVVDDGVTGLLVPVNDHKTMAKAICRILGDDALAATMAAKGREKVVAQFTFRKMVEGNLAIYRELQ